MARVKVRMTRGLDAAIAQLVAPQVHMVAKDVEAAAKKAAPGVKTWVSVGDARVRDQHVLVDATHPPIPENLRFELPSYAWDIEHYGVGTTTYMMWPKDHTSGLGEDAAAIHHCRCGPLTRESVDPAGLSRHIRTSSPVTVGKTVKVTVSLTAMLADKAEFGDVYPGSVPPAQGARYMQKGAASVRG